MPWEELLVQRGQAGDRTKWRIAVGSTGVRILPPHNHDLCNAKYVRSFFGTGHDAGWVLLKASNAGGRKVNKVKTAPPYLAFSTMPGLAKDFRLGQVETVGVDLPNNGGTKVQLPWVESPGYTATMPGSLDKDVRRHVDPGAGPKYAAPAPMPKPVDPATAAFVAGRAKPKAGKPERPSRADEQAAIDAHLATRGVTTTMTLEQAAEYLRTKGKDCVIRVGQKGRSNNQTTWLEAPEVLLEGVVVSIERLFHVVNDYRVRAELPPVNPPPAPPEPAPLKQGALPAVNKAAA